ncbi:hypothetical protein Hanom_Chr14g01290951 [Helianthus anomalus]
MKQIEENPKEKSRALAVIHDDEGVIWMLIESLKQEDEETQREWARQAEEEKLKSKKVDDRIIDTTKAMMPENLTKMAEKVLASKELEVVSKSASESKSKVSCSDSTNESGKTDKAKIESDCKNCMKNCKVCSTHAYLSAKKTKEMAAKVKTVEDQILSRDKLVKDLNERIKDLTDKIKKR